MAFDIYMVSSPCEKAS